MSEGQFLAAIYTNRLFAEYGTIASTALLCFDFTLTFASECDRIWRRRVTGATALFLLVRYTTVLLRVVVTLELILSRLSGGGCSVTLRAGDCLAIINNLAYASFAILHIYGVWGRDWKPLVLCAPVAMIAPVVSLLESIRYEPIQAGPVGFGCVKSFRLWKPIAVQSFLRISRTTQAVTTALIIVLTWIKTLKVHRDGRRVGARTPLMTFLSRDGSLYFGIFLAMHVLLAVISTVIVDDATRFLLVLPYFEEVLTAILLSRFTLDLRGLYFADPGRSSSILEPSTSLICRAFERLPISSSRIIGNIGATIRSSDDTKHLDSLNTGGDENEEAFSTYPFKEALLT